MAQQSPIEAQMLSGLNQEARERILRLCADFGIRPDDPIVAIVAAVRSGDIQLLDALARAEKAALSIEEIARELPSTINASALTAAAKEMRSALDLIDTPRLAVRLEKEVLGGVDRCLTDFSVRVREISRQNEQAVNSLAMETAAVNRSISQHHAGIAQLSSIGRNWIALAVIIGVIAGVVVQLLIKWI